MVRLNRIKEIAKAILIQIIRKGAYCLRIFPVKNNRILFMNLLADQYSCNLKYIHIKMVENYRNSFEYIWTYRHSDKPLFIDGVTTVKFNSLKWLFMMTTSKVIIVNTDLRRIYPVRENQLTINTWHAGGAYKKAGAAFSDEDAGLLCRTQNRAKVVLSSSAIFTEFNIHKGIDDQAEIWNSGMPRNDIMFSEERISRIAQKVRDVLKIQGTLVLYAPTFRNASHEGEYFNVNIEVDQLRTVCQSRYGKDVTILVRAHPDGKLNMSNTEGVVDVTDYPDMQELLCAAVMLVTDYSSSIWDYALLGRPCFLYVPDLKEYETNRGFFTPIETWPGIICHDMDELCYEIEHLDEERCREIARKHLEYAGSYEQGTACETVCRKIVDFCRGERS